MFQVSFLPFIIQHNKDNSSLIAVSNDNEVNALGITDMYPSQFEMSILKIYELKTTFQFTKDSQTLTYGIYIAAMFVQKDIQSVYLVVYVFVNTMDDYYVSNLEATFNYNLDCTYAGSTTQASGSPSDQSSFIQFDEELYEYYLHNVTMPKNFIMSLLSISITYSYTSSEFNTNGVITASAYLPAISDGDFVLFLIILIIAIVIGAR